MLLIILAILIILWMLGYLHITTFPIPQITLFVLNGTPVTLWTMLAFLVVIALIGVLPSPFREIAAVLFILWILSVLGIFSLFSFASLPAVLLGAIIIGLIGYMFAYR